MKVLAFSTIVASLVVLSGATTAKRPTLQDCGSQLPTDTRYSISIDAYWDTSNQPYKEDISIILRDEKKGVVPVQIPDEAQPFVTCIQSALGIG